MKLICRPFSYLRHLHADATLFVLPKSSDSSTSVSEMDKLKMYLDEAFTIKDLGAAKFFLGMEIARSEHGFYISQRKYIKDLLADFDHQNCAPAPTPLPGGFKFEADAQDVSNPYHNVEKYRRLVGRLGIRALYLSYTRPDLIYSVQQLSQFVQKPRDSHWNAAKHVLRYLAGSKSLGLFYSSAASTNLTAYSDTDWGSCRTSRHSLTGYCIFLGTNLVSWKTKKQCTIASSLAEAEYRAMAATVREVQWIQYMLGDFGVSSALPIPFHCDSRAALDITANPVFHERTKHIEIDCHVVRDQFKSGFILPQHISSSQQLANIFTKALSAPGFRAILGKMSLWSTHLEEGVLGCRKILAAQTTLHQHEDGADKKRVCRSASLHRIEHLDLADELRMRVAAESENAFSLNEEGRNVKRVELFDPP